MYVFVFDKRSLTLRLAGLAVIAVVLRTGGFLLPLEEPPAMSLQEPGTSESPSLPADGWR